MRHAPLRTSHLLAAALAAGFLSAPLSASADVAPAPKKKGCAVEAGVGDGRDGAAAFAVFAAAVAGGVVVRRARRRA